MAYLLVWFAFSAAATALQWAFQAMEWINPMIVSTSATLTSRLDRRAWHRVDGGRLGQPASGPVAGIVNDHLARKQWMLGDTYTLARPASARS